MVASFIPVLMTLMKSQSHSSSGKMKLKRAFFWTRFRLFELKLCTVVTIYGHDHEYNAK